MSRVTAAGVVAAVGVALLVGLILGIIGYSRVGPSATGFDAGLQAALLLFVTVAIATIAGAGGAVVASVVNARSARAIESAKQEGALRSRLADETLKAAVEFAASLQARQQELANQVARRQEVAAVPTGDPSSIPTVSSTDPVGESAARLYLIARQSTADLAIRAYDLLVSATAEFAYIAERDLVGGTVRALDKFEYANFVERMSKITDVKTAFMNAVRSELSLPVLVT